jgi:His-Xaa-Ser system radical SAM maturase HxsB
MGSIRKSVAVAPHAETGLAYARWRHLPDGGGTVVTNDAGRFHLMPRLGFERLLHGAPDDADAAALAERGFLRRAPKIDVLADRLRERRAYLFQGPSLHIIVITLRCDQICGYCHASRTNLDQPGYDMDEPTARAVVDRIFETTSRYITIEFQGGEPLVNWPILQSIVEYATAKNQSAGKELLFSLVTNMSQMTDEKCDWLIDRGVMICTSFDGPREVHEWNRHLARASSYDEVTRWIPEFHKRYAARGIDAELAYVNALLTVTRATLQSDPRAVVDEYRKLGLHAIHLRPLNPFGFATKTWQRIGYTGDEYLDFYRRAVDYIVELNLGGEVFVEKKMGLYLEKIFTDKDPNYMELRSPCGAGVGQMAYNFDGRVYTCDEGRMIGKMGDPIFEIGDVRDEGAAHRDYLAQPTVRAMAAASYLDAVPGCSDCAYNPYCGVCPIYNYVSQGDLFGKMPGSDWCRISMGVLDYLFGRLAREGESLRRVVEKWAEVKDRSAAYCAKPGSSMTY